MAKKFYLGEEFKDLEFLPMDLGGLEYLEDMRIAQEFAKSNRLIIAKEIMENFFGVSRIEDVEAIRSVHNYIGEDKIIRKGAISAKKGEKVVIPLNMRDGVILATGKGSVKWNQSCPHGAGRIMGRNEAKKRLSLEEFQKTMSNVWSSCISAKTLDEAPMAYKDKDVILSAIGECVEVTGIIKPVYNFKAEE